MRRTRIRVTRQPILVLSVLVAVLGAQQPQPTFRATTRLVEVTVTVLDKKGNAVAGLEAADFALLDEGKPRRVDVFRFDGRKPAAAARAEATLPPGAFTNRPSIADDAPRNVTALVLDTINTPPQQNAMARAQMLRYLRTLAPQTVVAVYAMGSRVRVLHDFTDDAVSLRARLENATLGLPLNSTVDVAQEAQKLLEVFGSDPASQAVAMELAGKETMANAAALRNRTERTLAQVEALGDHLAGIPGRKSLVWIGAGFAIAAGDLGVRRHGSLDVFEGQVRQLARRLAQRGIVMYVVDSRGVESPGLAVPANLRPSTPAPTRAMELDALTESINNDTRSAVELMASVTGGRYLFNTNDLTSGFKQVAADLQGSYSLGFYLPDNPDNKWHKLRVRVKRSGLTVRHREGYLADSEAAPVEWTDEMWRTAFTNPIGSSAIPLIAQCGWAGPGELAIVVSTEAGNLQFRPDGANLAATLELLIGDRTPDGFTGGRRSTVSAKVPAAEWNAASHREIRYSGIWKPAAGATGLRVVAYDEASGKSGTLDVPLNRVPAEDPK